MRVILSELSSFFIIFLDKVANLSKIIWSEFAFFVTLHAK